MSEIATKEEMKQRAERILASFKNLHETVLEDFHKEDVLYYSERLNSRFPAALYWLHNESEYENLVKDFEKRTGNLVFHVILTHTLMGDLLDMLFVSKYKDDWPYEDEDRKYGVYVSNCVNLSDMILSDMGSIQIKEAMGGLTRIS